MELSALGEIEEALDSLLGAIMAHREAKTGGKAAASLVLASPLSVEDLRPREMDLLSLMARDPIEAALRRSIRWIGKKLDEVGGIDQMRDSLERVAQLDSRHYQRRVAICDARWDGVGHWHR